MTDDPERRREVEPIVSVVATALPAVYLASGSLAVTALTAAVLIVVTARRG